MEEEKNVVNIQKHVMVHNVKYIQKNVTGLVQLLLQIISQNVNGQN